MQSAKRWRLTPTQRETVLRLIRNHLEMSLALRKDIFDAETIRMFAELVGTPNNLRLLTLLTYADIHSVNPEALTPWKAENLWRLYMATSNYLDRNVDEDRIEADADTAAVQQVIALSPENSAAIHSFLAGLPQRYLRTRSATGNSDPLAIGVAVRQRLSPAWCSLAPMPGGNAHSSQGTDRFYLPTPRAA